MRAIRLLSAFLLLVFVAATPAGTRHGLDVAGMDRNVRPGDDFFDYANGKWVAATTIPPDRSSFGAFSVISEMVDKRTADLIRDTKEKKIADYYAAYMDEKTIEARGLHPLDAELASIRAIHDKTSLARVIGSQLRADVDPLNNGSFHTDRLLGLWVSPDFAAPEVNAGYILQGGLGMPDRDYYLGTDEHAKATQAKYREHIEAVLKLAGIEGATEQAAKIYDLEHRIAEVHASLTDSEDVHKADNRWMRGDFSEHAPGLDWPTFFDAAGLSGQRSFFVWQPGAVKGESALAASEQIGRASCRERV